MYKRSNILISTGQEDAMSCDSSHDERMSCDEDDYKGDLGASLSPPIELHIPHILDNNPGDNAQG